MSVEALAQFDLPDGESRTEAEPVVERKLAGNPLISKLLGRHKQLGDKSAKVIAAFADDSAEELDAVTAASKSPDNEGSAESADDTVVNMVFDTNNNTWTTLH